MAIDLSKESIQEITLKLLDYCKKNDWAGYDPYDALNSKLLRYLPFLDVRFFRIGLTQLLKRSPINIRPLLLVPKMQNPKALALFLMAFLKLDKFSLLTDKKLIPLMVDRLIALRSPQELVASHSGLQACPPSKVTAGKPSSLQAFKPSGCIASQPSYFCWGYSFPWQTRTILVPRWAPNLVCTTFVANALLDAYERNGEQRCLEMAVGAAEYILNDLYWTDGGSTACLAYPLPSSRARVHNANFLGAALLCRVYKVCGDKKFLEPALKVTRYSAGKQNDDGSWVYGEDSSQRWIDNFHTGYNLCALKAICEYADTSEFEPHLRRGFEFYQRHFFTDRSVAKYFYNRTYPVDIHSVAQSLITLVKLGKGEDGENDLAESVLTWTMGHMWNTKGYFYHQTYPLFRIKTPYMRWSQAWMLLALSSLLEHA